MQVEAFVLGELKTNCYLLTNDNNEALIIDPADDGDFLNEELSRRNLKLVGVILTHGHFDHCLGLLSLKMAWPNLKIMMNFEDQFLLKKAQESARFWTGQSVDPVPAANFDLKDGNVIEFGEDSLKVISTPGHTPGGICLLTSEQEDGQKILFAGDTIFQNGIGRTDFSYSNWKKMQESLANLKEIKENGEYSIAMAGHGEMFY